MRRYKYLLALLGAWSFLPTTVHAEVIVADDFYYSQPTKEFGPGGGFTRQDYGGGQNGAAGLWLGRWGSSGDGIILGADVATGREDVAMCGDFGGGGGFAEAGHIGVFGWSYGGYMSLMCLARAPETFKVAVSGAPVVHWDGYDTHYTERYMGLPADNPDGYEVASVLNHVAGIQGKLLLVHGLIDENVHFRHTARLINALIAARKPYDLLLFPDERHSPRRLGDRVYMEERVRDYFLAHL